MNNLPYSPFSTPLSRAAKETELRLRNLFQWKKQRPPLPFLALMAAAALLCGGLVSCQAEPGGPASSLSQPEQPENPAEPPALGEGYWEAASQTLLARREDYSPEFGGSQELLRQAGEDLNLLLLAWSPGAHAGGLRNLLLGTFGQDGNLVDYYELGGDAGLYSSWEEADGLHLLWANSTTYTGQEGSSPPQHFRFDGKTLELVDQLPQTSQKQPENVPELLSQWGDWGDHKYLPIPGAVEVYRRTPGWLPMDPAWAETPQWEYLGVVHFTDSPVDTVPQPVRSAARDYIDSAQWEGVPTAGTPILYLEKNGEWDDFSHLSLCQEWKDKENLTLQAWDLEYGAPGEPGYLDGQTHLLFLREGEELTYLTPFDDYGSFADPEQGLLAGLSPYNWYAVEALYDGGYLTARPKLADIFTQVPAPQQAYALAEEWLAAVSPDAKITAMEPVLFVKDEPGWIGVYALEASQQQNGTWTALEPQLAFFEVSSFRSFQYCLRLCPEAEVDDVEQAALAAYYGLDDYEVALWDLSYMPYGRSAVGPGMNRQWFLSGGDRYEAEFLDGGSYLLRLDTTRRLPTTRGIKMGDSRDKVRSAYPELRSDPYPGLEGDLLWYCAGDPQTRPSLIFFFENGAVSRLVLNAPLNLQNSPS